MRASGGSDDAAAVLVVENDSNVAGAIEDVIEGLGYRSIWAADGREAILALRAERPALILIDMVLPVIGATELLAVLKSCANWRQIPRASICEADSVPTSVAADTLIIVPIDIHALARLIRRHCEAPGTLGQSRDRRAPARSHQRGLELLGDPLLALSPSGRRRPPPA